MPSTSQKHSSTPELDLIIFSIPQSVLLQIGTASMLLLLTAQKVASETLTAVGEASEEVLRGDRLPILNFPEEREEEGRRAGEQESRGAEEI
ncbi:MAG TPA: hypothetical protein VK184_18000 [Nostocaceae cyanobacterium]|nr:hypothetical protein [Nostocaceae cyanobacterium]